MNRVSHTKGLHYGLARVIIVPVGVRGGWKEDVDKILREIMAQNMTNLNKMIKTPYIKKLNISQAGHKQGKPHKGTA